MEPELFPLPHFPAEIRVGPLNDPASRNTCDRSAAQAKNEQCPSPDRTIHIFYLRIETLHEPDPLPRPDPLLFVSKCNKRAWHSGGRVRQAQICLLRVG